MFERRAIKRIAINQLALLHVDGIRGCHPCLVGNFHSDGAMLHSSTHHTAAFKFDLSLDGFKTTKHCRVVWRNGNTCGVKFVDKSDARAARAVGSSPTTATFVKLTQGGTDLFA
jgi:hypothetical protein